MERAACLLAPHDQLGVIGVLALLALAGAPAAGAAAPLDVEVQRGGRGLRLGNTLASFGNAPRLGVTTLELDTGVT
jgi:glycerophosphoryl diester phosphodiesterase